MKYGLWLGMAVLLCAGCSSTQQNTTDAYLLKPLRPYVAQVVSEMDQVDAERKVVLEEIAATIAYRLSLGKEAHLTFICSHNSRRSHMSQLWAQTAAYYYGLDHIYSFSGGTEATACNMRTVTALERAGFSIVKIGEGSNPEYRITYSPDRPPVRAYSKLYDADGNPKEDFIALMCCSKASKQCPVVFGATSRYAIHYVDPKLFDDTPEEEHVYEQRCREIAREMFYIMSHVRQQAGSSL